MPIISLNHSRVPNPKDTPTVTDPPEQGMPIPPETEEDERKHKLPPKELARESTRIHKPKNPTNSQDSGDWPQERQSHYREGTAAMLIVVLTYCNRTFVNSWPAMSLSSACGWHQAWQPCCNLSQVSDLPKSGPVHGTHA